MCFGDRLQAKLKIPPNGRHGYMNDFVKTCWLLFQEFFLYRGQLICFSCHRTISYLTPWAHQTSVFNFLWTHWKLHFYQDRFPMNDWLVEFSSESLFFFREIHMRPSFWTWIFGHLGVRLDILLAKCLCFI